MTDQMLPTITVEPPSFYIVHEIQSVLHQPLFIRRGQLAMDEHNMAVRNRLLHKLAKERKFDEGRRYLKQYYVQVWRGLALRESLESDVVDLEVI